MAALLDALYAQADEFIAIRHDIHSEPELAYEEFRTSDLVAERLASYGYAVHRGLGGTGVVGQLVRGSGAKRVGLRADMDALPIVETNTFGHASKRRGVMHACGHDGHTAMLLSAAKYLAASGRFDGTLNLIFQPAEEGKAGARRMIEDGLFERFPCDAVFGMHNMPGIAQGTFHVRPGAALASSDRVVITLHGVGGHGALPQRTADPIVAAASLVMALQTIVSRNVDPLDAAVVTVGMLHAGAASNVIPPSATMELSVRALDRDVRDLLERRIHALAQAQAESFGLRAEVNYERSYPVLVNTQAEAEFACSVARDLVGDGKVRWNAPPVTGSEDFAFMLDEVPGCYFFIGNGEGDGVGACSVHNPGYDFNDRNIGVGAAMWVALAQRFLQASA
ncbi:MAG: amidohydrolase [Burkholderiales bacterium]|nr:amidohydrolase [Burkholderiales bacterium]